MFSVAFNAPKDAQATLKACATPATVTTPTQKALKISELAFNNFAAKLTQLRISK